MPNPSDDRDPVAERRRNSAGFHDAVAATIAEKPKAPTHITRTQVDGDGLAVTVDDGKGTTVAVSTPQPGRLALGVMVDGRALTVEVPLGTATAIVEAIRAVAGLDAAAAPIVGHR